MVKMTYLSGLYHPAWGAQAQSLQICFGFSDSGAPGIGIVEQNRLENDRNTLETFAMEDNIMVLLIYLSSFALVFFSSKKDMADQAYEFDKFPCGSLPARLTRRQFFQGLVHELRAFARQEDHPVYRLSDLGEAPNEELAPIVPLRVPGSEIFQSEGFVWGKPPDSRNSVRLFPVDSPAFFVLEHFSGERAIVDISRDLAVVNSWDKQKAFAYVRGVFLWLALAKIVIPRGKR
jgi:hypothetical protein